MPQIAGQPTNFIGYVGTQADKTLEAMNIFDTLIRNMPEKAERLEMIKNYLVQSEFSNQPHFRERSTIVEYWKNMGYTEDPAKYNLSIYNDLTFDDILNFYKENLKEKAVVTIIVTNKKSVNPKTLAKYGKLNIVKEKSLFKK